MREQARLEPPALLCAHFLFEKCASCSKQQYTRTCRHTGLHTVQLRLATLRGQLDNKFSTRSST